jgi:predicted transposase YbfD/YdcC
VSFVSFAAHFAALPDPRIARKRRHDLLDIVVIALCAVICGAEGWDDIERFGLAKEDWFRERLGLVLPSGIPSDDTFRRVFSRLDTDAFAACFRGFVETLREVTAGEVIALDGKTLRHSFDTALGQKPLHLVSAWACRNRLVLGQQAVDDKSNEITAVPALLALLDIEGCVITADAMSCQKTIATQIVKQKGDYVLSLKDNHPHLAEDVAACFQNKQSGRTFAASVSHDFGHGRAETRRIRCLYLEPDDPDWFDIQQQWSGLRCLVEVERERRVGEKVTLEPHYFVTSLSRAKASPARLGKIVRQHWQIENGLHWILDVAMDEDACRIRRDNAPANWAILRHTALNLLRKHSGKMGVKAKQKKAGWDETFLLEVIVA